MLPKSCFELRLRIRVLTQIIFFRILLIQTNLDCNYTFPIDLAPNGIPLCDKSIGKVQLQSKFGLDQQDSEKNICVLLAHGQEDSTLGFCHRLSVKWGPIEAPLKPLDTILCAVLWGPITRPHDAERR